MDQINCYGILGLKVEYIARQTQVINHYGCNFKPINVQNSPKMCFGPKIPKYGNSVPDSLLPKKSKILIFFMFTISDSLIRFQRALNPYLEIILSQEMYKTVQKCVLGPKSPNIVIRFQTPQKSNILNFFMFTTSDSLIRFQRALNHYLEITLSQEMIFFQFLPIWANSARNSQSTTQHSHSLCRTHMPAKPIEYICI